MKVGDITHVSHIDGKPLVKPYYILVVGLKEPESFQRKFFPNQNAIPQRKTFNTREEAEQYAKQNLKQ